MVVVVWWEYPIERGNCPSGEMSGGICLREKCPGGMSGSQNLKLPSLQAINFITLMMLFGKRFDKLRHTRSRNWFTRCRKLEYKCIISVVETHGSETESTRDQRHEYD